MRHTQQGTLPTDGQQAGLPRTCDVQLAGTTPLAPTAAAHTQQGAEHEGCVVLVFGNVCVFVQPKGLWCRIDRQAINVFEVGLVGPCNAEQSAKGQVSRRRAHVRIAYMRRVSAQHAYVAQKPLWQAADDLDLGMAPGMARAMQVHTLPEGVRWVRA